MLNRKLVILDVETTGLNPEQDYVIELSAIRYSPELQKEESYLQRFSIPIPIPKEAIEVHGITDADLQGCPAIAEQIPTIVDFLEGCDIGGYNVLFDIKFLAAEFDRNGYEFEQDFKIIDVLRIFIKYEPRSLSAVYRRMFGTELENAHSAEEDVNATTDILAELINRGFCELDTEKLVELSDTTNLADFAGKFTRNAEGKLCWNFGKNFGKPVDSDEGYCNWFLNANFPSQSKKVLREYLNY